MSQTTTPSLSLDDRTSKSDAPTSKDADAKRAAPFMEKTIQRTLTQIPGAVSWGALPQIPMVFPVFVPVIPGWPSFFGAAVNVDRPEGAW